jgi:hypothetical protein
VSFDRAHDGDLRDRLVAESRGSSLFQVFASSELGEAGADDGENARGQIAAADAVIVICGEHTDACPGVSAELRITREEHKPHLLLWGRRAAMCKKPAGARSEEGIYGWTPEILRAQLQAMARAKREIPEGLRRQTPAAKASA